MAKQNCEIIFGPPGTGKTTRLIEEVERELDAGTEPERIAYVSFTNAAVDEARDRARSKLKLPQKRFPWFRTIHSLAHKALGIEFGTVMSAADYSRFGLRLSRHMEDRATRTTRDDRLLYLHSFLQSTEGDITRLKPEVRADIAELDYKDFEKSIRIWKRKHDKMEFADLLREFLVDGSPLPVEVAVVDEAQDLTPLQWRVIHRAFADARRLIVAGDDDQAVYEWTGATPRTLIELPGERRVLARSYRVPEYLRLYSERIIGRLPRRVKKEWSGTEFSAGVARVLHLAEVTFRHLKDGESYMLLARHQCYLQEMSNWLKANGWMHFMNDELSVPAEALDAVAQLDRIRGGERIPWHKCRELIRLSSGRVRQRAGDTVGLQELRKLNPLANVRPAVLVAVRDAQRRWGNNVPREPRIRLMTIHAAKGKQADNVVISPALTRAAAPHPSEEGVQDARLFYVAATRARHRFAVLTEPGPFRYPMPG